MVFLYFNPHFLSQKNRTVFSALRLFLFNRCLILGKIGATSLGLSFDNLHATTHISTL
jgi:hypothetical protein